MPIYEYECPKCKKVVEVVQTINHPAPLCPEDGEKMEKKVSLTARNARQWAESAGTD